MTKAPPFVEIVRAWAADKEQVTRLDITDVSWDAEEGWGGTDVTPGEDSRFIVRYTVHRQMMHSVDFEELGEFIAELSQTLVHGPITHIQAEEVEIGDSSLRPARSLDEVAVRFSEEGKQRVFRGIPLFVSDERYAEGGDDVHFHAKLPDFMQGIKIAVVFCEVKE